MGGMIPRSRKAVGDDLCLLGGAGEPFEREDEAGAEQERGDEGGEQARAREQARDPFQLGLSGGRKRRVEPQVRPVQREGGHEHRCHAAGTGHAGAGVDHLPCGRCERARGGDEAEGAEHLEAGEERQGPSARGGAHRHERCDRGHDRHRGRPRRPAEDVHRVERDQREEQEVEGQGDSCRHGRKGFRGWGRSPGWFPGRAPYDRGHRAMWTSGRADRRGRSSSDDVEFGEMHGMRAGPQRRVAIGVAGCLQWRADGLPEPGKRTLRAFPPRAANDVAVREPHRRPCAAAATGVRSRPMDSRLCGSHGKAQVPSFPRRRESIDLAASPHFSPSCERGRGDGQASACCASLGCFRKANASQGAQAYLTVRRAPWPRSTRRKQSDPRPQP